MAERASLFRGSTSLRLALVAALAMTGLGLVSGTTQTAVADTAVIQEFPVPSEGFEQPNGITVGPDGNLWFTERSAGKVGRITTAGALREFDVPGEPTGITRGADSRLWFLMPGQGRLAKMTTGGAVRQFPYDGFYPQPEALHDGITLGPDGNVWFTDPVTQIIGRVTPAGQITTRMVEGGPLGITTGPDGNIWFGTRTGRTIGRISPTFEGLTLFPLPPPANGNDPRRQSVPGITTGPDGNLWFTDLANLVGRITLTGQVREFPLPGSASEPLGITAGPDGNVWFTEGFGNSIARVTPTGKISEVLLPTPEARPTGITLGPDGKLWFTETGANQIGRLDPATLVPPPRPCLVVRADTTLTRDVGPCAGDGIVVRANNVTLDLNQFKVFAAPGRRTGDFAGVRLDGVTGVTVKGGEITGFDAGVVVDGGGGNTISRLNVHDNLGPPDSASELGDGIVLFHSGGNRIIGNIVRHNGIYDGIGVLGVDSNENLVQDNVVTDNTDLGNVNAPGGGTGIIVNPFLEVENPRRGESLTGNDVVTNLIRDNTSSGISNVSNVGGIIRGNVVEGNGVRPDGSPGNEPGNGIGVQANQAATRITNNLVDSNVVRHNWGSGITVSTQGNRILDNVTIGNGRYPDNVGIDLFDSTSFVTGVECHGNRWRRNRWGFFDGLPVGSYYPDCTSVEGTGPRPGVASLQEAAAQAASTAERRPGSRGARSR